MMTDSDGRFETYFRQDTPVLFSCSFVLFIQKCTLQRVDHQKDMYLAATAWIDFLQMAKFQGSRGSLVGSDILWILWYFNYLMYFMDIYGISFQAGFSFAKMHSTQNPSKYYSFPKINSQTISHGPILSEFRSKSSGRFLQLLLEFRLLFTDLSRFLQLPFWSTVLCSANLWASFSKFWALFSKFCCSCEVEWTKLCNSIFSIRNRALLPSDLIIGASLA